MGDTTSGKVYGEPDEWEFEYTWEVIQIAFWLWAMSGFKYLPNQEEVLRYDPRYISDIKLAHTIYAHQANNSFEMKMYEQWMAFQENPEGMKEYAKVMRNAKETDMATNMPKKQTNSRHRR